MKKYVFSILLFLVGQHSLSAQHSLRNDLEKTYHSWKKAMISKDYKEWSQATSQYRRMLTRNTIISQRAPFPESIFESPIIRPPEIALLRFIKVKRIGNTAHAYYFGKIDFGIPQEEIPENLLILIFFKEGNQWKYNTLQHINLESVPEVRQQLKRRDYQFLDEAAFQPSGVLPPAPKRCRTPDYHGVLHIVATGYEVEVTIENTSHHHAKNTTISETILGGLIRGTNKIVIKSKQTFLPQEMENEKRHVEVSVFVMPDHEKQRIIRVFHFQPEKMLPTHEYKGEIWSNAATLLKRDKRSDAKK